MEEDDRLFYKKVSRWWLVFLIACLCAAVSFFCEQTAPFIGSVAVAIVAFIVIDWMHSNDGTGSTPTIYGAC